MIMRKPARGNKCVLLVTQALEDEDKTITMKGTSGRFTGAQWVEVPASMRTARRPA